MWLHYLHHLRFFVFFVLSSSAHLRCLRFVLFFTYVVSPSPLTSPALPASVFIFNPAVHRMGSYVKYISCSLDISPRVDNQCT